MMKMRMNGKNKTQSQEMSMYVKTEISRATATKKTTITKQTAKRHIRRLIY